MAEEPEKKTENVKKEERPKKPLIRWIIIGCIVAIAGAGGFIGWKMLAGKGADEKNIEDKTHGASEKEALKEEKVIYPLEPFIVNLVDESGSGKRYLKAAIELEVGGEPGKKKVEARKTVVKDAVLMLLSSRSFEEINSVEGKQELKQALLTQINQALGENMVLKIYFVEFVVQ
jgi:flagellar FliL protein